MTKICLTFHIHHPYQLKAFSFFDMGMNRAYFDDLLNKTNIEVLTEQNYLATNHFLLDLLKIYPDYFKVNFLMSGVALGQIEKYSPELLHTFKALAKHKNVEFLGCSFAHSLASTYDKSEFQRQVQQHKITLQELLDITPTTFCNTHFLYDDELGEIIHTMGYNTVIAEDAEAILGWNSGNQYYAHPTSTDLKLAFSNCAASDYVSNRMLDDAWKNNPINEIEFAKWTDQLTHSDETIQLHLPYTILGGQFLRSKQHFISALMELLTGMNIELSTISESSSQSQNLSPLSVPTMPCNSSKTSLGIIENPLQEEAIEKLYTLAPIVLQSADTEILNTWNKLQSYDHFRWMKKANDDRDIYSKNPYENGYDAFINYMNILNDFALYLGEDDESENPNPLSQNLLRNQLAQKNKEIEKQKKQLRKIKKAVEALNKQVKKGE